MNTPQLQKWLAGLIRECEENCFAKSTGGPPNPEVEEYHVEHAIPGQPVTTGGLQLTFPDGSEFVVTLHQVPNERYLALSSLMPPLD